APAAATGRYSNPRHAQRRHGRREGRGGRRAQGPRRAWGRRGLPDALAAEFRAVTGPGGFLIQPEELRTYECDALTNMRALPLAVLLPPSTEQVQAIVRVCHRERVPFVARGAGTGLSGGALPVDQGIVISL